MNYFHEILHRFWYCIFNFLKTTFCFHIFSLSLPLHCKNFVIWNQWIFSFIAKTKWIWIRIYPFIFLVQETKVFQFSHIFAFRAHKFHSWAIFIKIFKFNMGVITNVVGLAQVTDCEIFEECVDTWEVIVLCISLVNHQYR